MHYVRHEKYVNDKDSYSASKNYLLDVLSFRRPCLTSSGPLLHTPGSIHLTLIGIPPTISMHSYKYIPVKANSSASLFCLEEACSVSFPCIPPTEVDVEFVDHSNSASSTLGLAFQDA